MKWSSFFSLCLFVSSFSLWCSEDHWPGFRGPGGGGVATTGETVRDWNLETGEHVQWQVPLRGMGFSSPIVWGDRIFVTMAVVPDKEPALRLGLYGDIASVEESDVQQYTLQCLDRRSGSILWQKIVHKGVPKAKRHTKSSHANPTPATDGKRVVSFFGSEGLYCHDMDGNLLWKKDLGLLDAGFFRIPKAQWGFSSSPVLHEGVVYLQCDTISQKFVAAVDAQTGKELWRTAREEVPTFSTPAVFTHGGRTQMVVNGWKHMGGYDAKTGKSLWRMSGTGDIPVPVPQYAHGLIFITNAHGGPSPIYAIKADAVGDLSKTESKEKFMAWSVPKGGAYMPTPLVLGDHLYVCGDRGILTCFDAKTGERLYQERLGEGNAFTASPVASSGKLYCSAESGEVFVIKAGPSFEQLAVNQMDAYLMATPAIAQGTIYFRTGKGLVAVGK